MSSAFHGTSSDETASTTMLFATPIVNTPVNQINNQSNSSLTGHYIPAAATNADVQPARWTDNFERTASRKTFFRSVLPFRIPESGEGPLPR
jgi:hypothetical protein